MGIRVKNLSNHILRLRSAGTLTAATDKDIATVPFDGFVSNVYAQCTSGGTGSTASIVDIHYLGTTIFSAATKVTLASTTGVVSYSALTSQPLAVTAGAYFTMDVDSIALAPANVEVMITITKTGVSSNQNASDHNLCL